ncbi:branched-chain amino acid ABC transporter substrate-binding protein [Conexibacter sp. CPCC 206217]|uniref:branched-chain amino acid ABC transporter substrate-binding protein n=1 Tax=Conexibacter sp. CPCC 206217 TaxID=3064574 RepID=UPI0027158284|nr:branched-chain amino acid ABC transporter substrate-binding protein [Conexibacter sp. CPCC 206217]MDO8210969.1 branched-chain amino acid ABC transporter substrate-binding protein [Conexibacter sp. CPCC 206217]
MLRSFSSSSTRRRPLPLLAALVCLLALLLAGCGDGEDASGRPVAGTRLAIYSSMPLEGPDRTPALDVVRAQQMALRDAGSTAGRYDIDLVSLDAATPKENSWDPAQISDNARRAAKDDDAIAYLGEFHTSSSAISIPLVNEVGMLEVSPMDTATALTARNLAVPDSPAKYFPKGKDYGRTFARVVPSDREQAAAQIEYMRQEGVRRLVMLTDEDPVGVDYVTALRALARAHGIAIVGREDVDPHEQDPRDLVEKIELARPDAVFYAGDTHDGVVRLWQDLSVADPMLKLFLPGSAVDAAFVESIGAAAASTYVTRPVLGLRAYPAAAQKFAKAFERRYGKRPEPEALYGYEAMSAVLAAIRRAVQEAGDGRLDRADVVRAFRDTRRRGTVLGDYEILSNGDTTLRRFGAYRIVGGQLKYMHPLEG